MKKKKSNTGRWVYSAYITLKNGKRLYASAYGLKVFRFWVED
jgi:hypothetical protein